MLQVGTPICIPSKEFIDIGKVTSIEINHKQVDMATKGQKVAIKVTRINIASYCGRMFFGTSMPDLVLFIASR